MPRNWLTDGPEFRLGILGASLLPIGYLCFRAFSNPSKGLPPGPPSDPIIGALRSFPKSHWYKAFNDWQDVYGDLVFVQLPGTTILIINSLDLANTLLSKRADNNSDRKVGYMVMELMGWKWNVGFRQADASHKNIRKMLRRGIGPQRVASHDALIERSGSQFLVELCNFGGDPVPIITHAIGRILIQVAYGAKVWNKNGEKILKINVEALEYLDPSFNKLWMVDIFPILRFVPSWMPWAGFQRWAKESRSLLSKVRGWPFKQSVELYKSSELDHSLAHDLFDEFGQSEDAQDALAILHAAGVDTTTSVLTHFFYHMLIFPEVAAKVQAEIDQVIGNDRIPNAVDSTSLPYMRAVWKESLRWNPAIPLAIPHVNRQDETINGYFIPRGTILNPNIGFMLNDPRIWKDPDVYRPERHLASHNPAASTLPDPSLLVFGFGTRICAGMYLAERVGLHLAVSVMALFDIMPLEGSSRPEPSKVDFSDAFVRYPKDFKCRFIPRGKKALDIISDMKISDTYA